MTNNKAEAMAWAVSCPPTDECDYRVYFTELDALIADENFRDECSTDEEDAERRTPGVTPLYPAPPPGHILTDDGTVRKVLGTLPVTADGVVCGRGAELYSPDGGGGPCPDGHSKMYVQDTTSYPEAHYFIGGWYSTREAAEAARAKP